MVDNLKKEYRRKNMQNIRSSNTKMELRVHTALKARSLRFRKNVVSLEGKPDIVFPKSKVIIFLDSCFWHVCPYHSNIPQSNRKYWLPKLRRNKVRDKEVNAQLRKEGWKVMRFWEHQIKNKFETSIDRIIKMVEAKRKEFLLNRDIHSSSVKHKSSEKSFA